MVTTLAAIAALLVLGSSASTIAAGRGLALEALASRPNTIWTPEECPLCARRVPLIDGAALSEWP